MNVRCECGQYRLIDIVLTRFFFMGGRDVLKQDLERLGRFVDAG